jgi:hypothetical protein
MGGDPMTLNLGEFDWQAVASLLTFAAVAIALWEVNAQRRDVKARAGHITQMIGLMLIAFMVGLKSHLEETEPAETEQIRPGESKEKVPSSEQTEASEVIQLPQELRELAGEIFTVFKDAFVIVEPKRYAPMAKICSQLLIIRAHDSMHRSVAQDLVGDVRSYLTNTLEAPTIGPILPPGWGAKRP